MTNQNPHVRDALSAWMDGELSAAERRAVDQHLETCSECRAIANDLARLDEARRHEPIPAPPPDLAARIAERVRLESGAGAVSEPSLATLGEPADPGISGSPGLNKGTAIDRLQNRTEEKRPIRPSRFRSTSTWMIPAAASLAAVLLIVVLVRRSPLQAPLAVAPSETNSEVRSKADTGTTTRDGDQDAKEADRTGIAGADTKVSADDAARGAKSAESAKPVDSIGAKSGRPHEVPPRTFKGDLPVAPGAPGPSRGVVGGVVGGVPGGVLGGRLDAPAEGTAGPAGAAEAPAKSLARQAPETASNEVREPASLSATTAPFAPSPAPSGAKDERAATGAAVGPSPASVPSSPEEREALQALGYVSGAQAQKQNREEAKTAKRSADKEAAQPVQEAATAQYLDSAAPTCATVWFAVPGTVTPASLGGAAADDTAKSKLAFDRFASSAGGRIVQVGKGSPDLLIVPAADWPRFLTSLGEARVKALGLPAAVPAGYACAAIRVEAATVK